MVINACQKLVHYYRRVLKTSAVPLLRLSSGAPKLPTVHLIFWLLAKRGFGLFIGNRYTFVL